MLFLQFVVLTDHQPTLWCHWLSTSGACRCIKRLPSTLWTHASIDNCRIPWLTPPPNSICLVNRVCELVASARSSSSSASPSSLSKTTSPRTILAYGSHPHSYSWHWRMSKNYQISPPRRTKTIDVQYSIYNFDLPSKCFASVATFRLTATKDWISERKRSIWIEVDRNPEKWYTNAEVSVPVVYAICTVNFFLKLHLGDGAKVTDYLYVWRTYYPSGSTPPAGGEDNTVSESLSYGGVDLKQTVRGRSPNCLSGMGLFGGSRWAIVYFKT